MTADIQVLVLEGRARQRGQIHGESLRPLIHEHIARWQDHLRQDMGMEPDAYLEQFFQETDFAPAIQRWTPDLLEEVRGIAEGAGVDFKYVLVRQLSDEEPWYRFEKKVQALGRADENCSAAGVQAHGAAPPILAQNMDTPAYYDGHQVLLHVKDPATLASSAEPSPVEALVFTVAGKISLAGLNNHGVGICCNTLIQLDFAADGLPEDFIVRGFLARPTLEDGLAFMRGVKHASGQNYVVGGPGRVLDLECSARQICEFVPFPGANRVYHTNHPLVNPDQSLHRRRLAKMPPEVLKWYQERSTSFRRFASLEKHLGDPAETMTVEHIKTALSSHDGPVCIDRGISDLITLGCLIMELSPAPALHLAPGPACSTPFKTYTFGAK